MSDGTAPGGTRLLSREGMARMQEPIVPASGGNEWGLSWGVRQHAGVRVVMHGGATAGQLSAFMMVPDRKFAITVLTNADRGAALHQEITTWALEYFLELHELEPQVLSLSPAELEVYAGRYIGAGSTSDVELRLDGGQLLASLMLKGGFPTKDSPPPPVPPPAHIGFVGPDRWIVLDGLAKGQRGEFLRDQDGRIAWLRWSRIRSRQ
jgi:CubicO group peptidase (beta-lactamase class C family)